MDDKPALLGGSPAFERTFPIIRPSADEAASPALLDRIGAVLRSNMLSNVGICVRELEDRLASRLHVDHVVATSSCTLGLILTLHALGARGHTVGLPSFTFSATGLACYWNDARLRYVDIDDTLTLSPEGLAELRTGVEILLPVHMYGNPCDVEGIRDWAARRKLGVVYDAAHALGSWHGNRPIGGFGTAEVFSLSPTKLITTGEGGFVATNDNRLAARLQILRNYGNNPDYTTDSPGLNARMSELSAVLGIEMLGSLDRYVSSRERYVGRYRHGLQNVPGLTFQRIRPGARSSHKDFSIILDPARFGLHRDELAEALAAERIVTKKYFYPPMHKLRPFRPRGRVNLRVTERVSNNLLSMPIHNVMREEDLDRIIERIVQIQASAAEIRKALTAASKRQSSKAA